MIEKMRQSWLWRRADLLALVALPLAFLLINPVWLDNRFGDIDVWFYYGHFKTIFHQNLSDGMIPSDYLRTRLPIILPGALLYSVFSERVAQFLFMAFVYLGIVGSFWFVLQSYVSRAVAFAGTAFFATDIFMLRTFGWDYVDTGVLLYEGLAFAFLTASVGSKRPWAFQILAGFATACMIFCHLGSFLVVGLIAAYGLFVEFRKPARRGLALRLAVLISAGTLGVMLAQLVFGVLNERINHNSFFFLLEQIDAAAKETSATIYMTFVSELIRSGTWLVVPGGVLLASAGALGLSFFRKKSLRDFDVFCWMGAGSVFGLAVLLQLTGTGCLLSRTGFYTSFFQIPVYWALACLLLAPLGDRWGLALVAYLAALGALAVRLLIGDGMGLVSNRLVPPLLLIAVVGSVLFVPVLVRKKAAALFSILALCATLCFVPWKFVADPMVSETSNLLSSVAKGRVPRIYYDKREALDENFLLSVIAAQTERAAWRHGDRYPDFSSVAFPPSAGFHSGDFVVVISGKIASSEEVLKALAPFVDRAFLVASFKVVREGTPYWLHCFDVENKIGITSPAAAFKQADGSLPGAALPFLGGSVQGTSRVATEGVDAQGVLTFGPFAKLEPGRYRLSIVYETTGAGHGWDVLGGPVQKSSVLQQGTLPDTRGQEGTLILSLDAPEEFSEVQLRTSFSGKGRLVVKSVSIRPASSSVDDQVKPEENQPHPGGG